MIRAVLILTLAVAGGIPGAGAQAAAEPTAAAVEFFEAKVRPLLVEHCYQCHSAKAEKVKGGLWLDSREGLLQGGDSGPAIVPGDPEKSLLIRAVRYTDEHVKMPPKDKKLSAEQIATLETWIGMGAPFPKTGLANAGAAAPDAAEKHWAFQPVQRPSIPAVRAGDRVQTPIDAFVLAKLEAKNLSLSPPADKRTLIRRVSFDLTGLPPTPEEVAEFVGDNSKEAFAKVVDRLLASPRFGERWARHWLDVARYADTKGYVFEEERRYPYSYTYRDYVIRAFNEDLPYDRFLIEQIAADLLPLGEDKRALAALGYLTLGRRFLNNQHDIIDDRIDVVTRGMMGLTVTCARCHDHKYDPIPIADYYSLYGVFASSSEPNDKPMLGVGTMPPGYDEYLEERKKRQEELENFRAAKEAEALSQLRQKTGEYLLAAYDARELQDESKVESLARERKLHPQTTQRWIARLNELRKEKSHPIFGPWFALEQAAKEEFGNQARELALQWATQSTGESLNPLIALAFAGEPPGSMKEVAERYGRVFADIEKKWQETLKTQRALSKDGALKGFADANLEALRQVLYAENSPAQVPAGEFRRLFDVPTGQRLRALQRKLEELDATHPGAPPRAMALQDNPVPAKPRVFMRGNPSNPGPEVPRQFLQVLAGSNRKPFEKGSGRLELAQAIADRNNPLTARVIVNRIWLQYFGAGLVRTPSDFGLRCEPPTHPELLDYLAARFMDEGWSLKKLHRLIVLSSVYQQSSDFNAAAAQIDPNNDLLWRMNRKRLDFESMRDSLLAVAGKIDLSIGGRPVDITTPPFTSRRTVYGFVERQNLPSMFRTFDFANPDTTSPQRFLTTVPQQGLFMLNSPFVIQLAREFATRPDAQHASVSERVRLLYQAAFQREPTDEEIQLGARFIESQSAIAPEPQHEPVWQYGYGEYDEQARRTKVFKPLPHFTGQAWQGGAKVPDDKLGWVMLTSAGGHPGNDRQHAAIRRWTAPQDGLVTIAGTLAHDSDKGDGIRGRIVSSRQGELGAWTVQKSRQEISLAEVEVKAGDTIDFIAECRESVENDSFTWAPVIGLAKAASSSSGRTTVEWNAKAEFSGPKEPVKPLSAWEKYAQVLLMSNELVFVD